MPLCGRDLHSFPSMYPHRADGELSFHKVGCRGGCWGGSPPEGVSLIGDIRGSRKQILNVGMRGKSKCEAENYLDRHRIALDNEGAHELDSR
jgi:hypothetical protein